MSVDIIIDSHEEKLIAALESDYLKKECDHLLFDIATLDIGDIIIKRNEHTLCLIERKTVEDYASSITDGRSKNQSIRISQLTKENPEIIIIYLIEGDFLQKDYKFRNGITRDSLYSSIINRIVRDGFTIYRTADIYDTALTITKLYDKIVEHTHKKKPSDEKLDYLKTIKLAKKENMTPDNCYMCQLAQIPGVSIETANVIAKQYTSMQQLILAYEKLDTIPDKEKLLAELSLQLANDKSRRLGHVISKRIYEYLYGVSEKKKIPIKLKDNSS